MKLFDGSDSENENEDPKIEVDKEFARRYEHNKKREDLQRYEELKKRGQIPGGDDEDSDEESSSSDEDVVSAHSKKDLKFFEALMKVRKKDPSLKSKDVKLFDSDEETDRRSDEREKKTKAVYLKDVVAKQLIEDGPDFDQDDEDDINNNNNNNNNKLVYDNEQEEIRNAFLKTVDGDGEVNDPLLTVKAKTGGAAEEDDDDEELRKKVDEYFEEEEDDGSRFLKDYFVNKMWIDKRAPLNDDDDDDNDSENIIEDEEEVERQEEYEYRYQEGAADRVLGHSREVAGSVRKRPSTRKEQRRHKEERAEAARAEREEELRRLKNLKRKEMEDRVCRIMEIAGVQGGASRSLTAEELDQDFDPEDYDRMMEKAFGDEYYAADVAANEDDDDNDDDDDDDDKPNFDAEDEELGLPKGWDGREEEWVDDGKMKKKKMAVVEKAKEEMMEEYYKLDYEDTIGDLKTRFKYANTKGKRYGLSAAAILMMDDKELNQYVPLNKIAPYKDKEWKVPESKRSEMKAKVDELLRRGRRAEPRKSGKRKAVVASSSSSSPAVEERGGEPTVLSKTAKRRKNRADLKLSTSRLLAYGKISSSKPKKKPRS